VGRRVICPRNDAAASNHMPSLPSLRAQQRFVCDTYTGEAIQQDL